jgi:tryptophanase
MDAVAESVAEVWDQRDSVISLQMVYEPSDLRFFQAHLEPVG